MLAAQAERAPRKATAAATSPDAARSRALAKARRALAEKRRREREQEQQRKAQRLEQLRSQLAGAEREYDEAYRLATSFEDRPRFAEREARAWDRADRAQAGVLAALAAIRRIEAELRAERPGRGQ